VGLLADTEGHIEKYNRDRDGRDRTPISDRSFALQSRCVLAWSTSWRGSFLEFWDLKGETDAATAIQNNALGIFARVVKQFGRSSVLWESGTAGDGDVAADICASITLTTAQLLALQTTAGQLVAPPVITEGDSVPNGAFLTSPTALTPITISRERLSRLRVSDNAFQNRLHGQVHILATMAVMACRQAAELLTKICGLAVGTEISAAICKTWVWK